MIVFRLNLMLKSRLSHPILFIKGRPRLKLNYLISIFKYIVFGLGYVHFILAWVLLKVTFMAIVTLGPPKGFISHNL